MRRVSYAPRIRQPVVATVLAVLAAACATEDLIDLPVDLTVSVLAEGDGSGVVSVETPDLPVFGWECTVVDGQTVGDGRNVGRCSRDYTLSDPVAHTEVVFRAQGTDGRFVEWGNGGECSGTDTTCRITAQGGDLILVEARFEASVATVELTVEGGADPVTLLQGLTAPAVATALRAGGQGLSGATFTWASSDPGVASVTGSSGGSAMVRGESPGTATITAMSGGVSSNPVTVTVTGLQSAKGILQGVLYDVDGTTPLDSVYLSGGPVQGSQGDALRGRTGRQNPLDPGGIPAGGYRFEATNGRYALFTVAVLGNRYVSTPGDTADVFADQTTTMDMNVADGYHLDMLDTDLGTIQASAGTVINVVVDYRAWNRDMCAGCVPSLGIGVDATALAVYRFGIPGVYPGKSETSVSIPITVPAQGGTIYATLITVSTGAGVEPGLEQYRDRWAANVQATTMIPIGTLVVN